MVTFITDGSINNYLVRKFEKVFPIHLIDINITLVAHNTCLIKRKFINPLFILYAVYDLIINFIMQKFRIVNSISPTNNQNDSQPSSQTIHRNNLGVKITFHNLYNFPLFDFLFVSLNFFRFVDVDLEYSIDGKLYRRQLRYPSYRSPLYLRDYVIKNIATLIISDLSNLPQLDRINVLQYSSCNNLKTVSNAHDANSINVNQTNLLISIARFVVSYLQDSFKKKSNWEIKILKKDDFIEIRLPLQENHWYADPFLFEIKGKTYLFFENYNLQKGFACISYFDFSDNSIHDCIVENFHLSFPFLMIDGGDIYLSVESYSSGGIRIYKTSNFPSEWELVDIVLPNLSFVDAVFFKNDSKWFAIATQKSFFGNDYYSNLVLYCSDTLVGGDWHDFAINPILVDCSIGRNAGLLTIHDKLYRLAQNNSNGIYGFDISERLISLFGNKYVEIPSDFLSINKPKEVFQFHTFTQTNHYVSFDFKMN